MSQGDVPQIGKGPLALNRLMERGVVYDGNLLKKMSLELEDGMTVEVDFSDHKFVYHIPNGDTSTLADVFIQARELAKRYEPDAVNVRLEFNVVPDTSDLPPFDFSELFPNLPPLV